MVWGLSMDRFCLKVKVTVKVFDCWKAAKYFLFSIWISICRIKACKSFEKQSKINVFMAKMNFE